MEMMIARRVDEVARHRHAFGDEAPGFSNKQDFPCRHMRCDAVLERVFIRCGKQWLTGHVDQ